MNIMKFNFLIIIFSLLISCNSSSEKDSQKNDVYHLTFSQKKPNQVTVKAEITLTDSLLVMSKNGPMPDRWDDYIANVQIQNLDGQSLELKKQENDTWLVKNIKTPLRIKLQYTLELKHEEIEWPGGIDGVAFHRDWGVFLTGRSIFLMNGKDKKDIEVNFVVPEEHLVSVPWLGKDNKFIAINLDDLSESLIFAGKHKQLVLKREGLEVRFALCGEEIEEQEQEYQRIAEDLLTYYVEMMGGLPKVGADKANSIILTIINPSEKIDGEVIGSHINMFMNPDGDRKSKLQAWFMFAHEFFHLWNGRTFNPTDTKGDWFKEGLTNYYTFKALHEIGFSDRETLKMVFNFLMYNRYINDPGLGKMAPTQAASGFDKDNHWGLVYGGGMFTGICMDLTIRKNTKNAKSIDDLMRKLYTKYGGTDTNYTTDDIIAEINLLSGEDQSAFFNNYIRGTGTIPLSEYLTEAGFIVSVKNGNITLQDDPVASELQLKIRDGFFGKID